MPTYTYQCHSCGKIFEKEQKITEEPLKECPYCGGQVKRLITGGMGFILKGTGWYVTDYKNKSQTSRAESAKGKQCCKKGISCANPKRCCEKN